MEKMILVIALIDFNSNNEVIVLTNRLGEPNLSWTPYKDVLLSSRFMEQRGSLEDIKDAIRDPESKISAALTFLKKRTSFLQTGKVAICSITRRGNGYTLSEM